MINTEQIRIEFSGLPGVYPDGYTDKIYLDNARPVKVGQKQDFFNTQEKYTTTQDLIYKNLNVQTQTYDQYKIETIRKESQSYELLKAANIVKIIDTSQNITYNAIIIDVLTEDVFNSTFQKVTIEFFDTNIDNYIGVQPIVDHLKSDVVYRLFTPNVNKLTTSANTYYSIINGTLITLDPENDKTEELNGKNISTRVTVKSAIKSVFYVSESQIQNLKQWLIYTGISSFSISIYNDSKTYTAEERPTWTLEQVSNAVDLWKLEITLVYQINDITPYA